MLRLCIGSDLARPALGSSSPDDQEAAGADALLRELLAHELDGELGLLVGEHGEVGDLCTPACQNCLIVCAITCVVNANPIACYDNCTVATGCICICVKSACMYRSSCTPVCVLPCQID